MSSALNTAIYQRLVGLEILTGDYLAAQQTLARLLAQDPDTALPAVHAGNASDVSVYPAITFRANAGVIDKRFTLGHTAVGLVYVDQPIYDLEVWGKSRAGNELSDIDDALSLLLDQRLGCPHIPLQGGLVDLATTLVSPSKLYDQERHAWCLLRRIQFKTRISS